MTITTLVPAQPMTPAASLPCNPVVNPLCWVIKEAKGPVTHAAASAGNAAMDGLTKWLQDGVKWLVENTLTLWLKTPSPDLTKEPAVAAMHKWLLPISLAVAVGATLVAAGKMAITGKANPLLDVGQGLVIVIVTGALSTAFPTLVLKASDQWSTWVIDQSLDGKTTSAIGKDLGALLSFSNGSAPGGVVAPLCVVALVVSAIQAIMMLFRTAAVIILAGVAPVAAAGSLAPGTRIWIQKIFGWGLAVITFKDAASAEYATTLTFIGRARGFWASLIALMMFILMLAAFPVMLKFFTWTTGQVGSSGGGGGLLAAGVSGAVAVGSFRGGGGAGGASASDHARFMTTSGSGQSGSSSSPPSGLPRRGNEGERDESKGPSVRPVGSTGSAAPAAAGQTGATAATSSSAAGATTAATAAAGPVGAGVQAGVQVAQTVSQVAKDVGESAGPPQKEN